MAPFDVREDETLEDLQFAGMRILQKKEGFRFGTDAVLLADFAKIRGKDRVLDLGTGTGILPVLLCARHPGISVTALEIQEEAAGMAARSMEGNGLADRVSVLNEDLRRIREYLPPCAFDAVVCNPPYTPLGKGIQAERESVHLSRHEETCSLRDAAKAAFYALRPGGKAAFCLPPERIAEALQVFSEERITPKVLRLVHFDARHAPRLLLVSCTREAKTGLSFLPPLLLRDEEGRESAEYRRIYHMEGAPEA